MTLTSVIYAHAYLSRRNAYRAYSRRWRPLARMRRRIRRWRRAWSPPTLPGPRAEVWQGLHRKTYLVPYQTSWTVLDAVEAATLRRRVQVLPAAHSWVRSTR